MKIKELLTEIEKHFPLALQENYDNSGVQIGDIHQEAKAALFCIDVTEEVLEEAMSLSCNLIISHHPIAFHSFKSLTGKTYIERCMIKACKNDIVLYAAHTNLDNSETGINQYLANLLNLENLRILAPKENSLVKLVTFVPDSHVEKAKSALFAAGCGHIGEYDSCSFSQGGEGSFRPGPNSHPYSGVVNEMSRVAEQRLELILPRYIQREAIRALIAVHPYEEPVYDIYELKNDWRQAGAGLVGSLVEPMDELDFLYYLKEKLHLNSIQYSALRSKPIRDVALCGGSGAFLIPNAIHYGADIFITGEAKYNDYYDVEDKLVLASIGHYESEIYTKNIFYKIISEKYPNFATHMSGFDANPVNYL